MAFIIGLLALALYFPVKQRLVSITDSSYKILSNNLASSIYDFYQKENFDEVRKAVHRVEVQSGVKYVLVINKDDTVIYDTLSGTPSLENKKLGSDSLSALSAKGDTVVGKVTRDGASYYNYVAPFISGNKLLYTVRLGIDQDIIDGEFNRLTHLFLYLAAFGILMGIIAAYISASRLSKPIILLTESALAIRAGNLNAYPEISTNDELEQLSREFQSMVEKLKQFYFQEYTQKRQALHAKRRLEEINNRLQELDRQKSDFLNTASHQLRTPLSIIHWSLSLIVEESANLNLKPEQLELLTESLKSTKRMVDLVNDLLDISRIEQGRKELSWAKGNIATVCAALVESLQVLANNKKLALTFEKSPDIPDSYFDERAFYQVINNFVDNAIKYTDAGFVKVACAVNNGLIEIKISDSGIGMTEQEKSTLFVTKFNRGNDAAKRFTNGSGLGMYVAYSMLRQHGGQVEVQSEKGKGTTFTIKIPIYTEIPNIPVEPEVKAEDALPMPIAQAIVSAHPHPQESPPAITAAPAAKPGFNSA